MLMTAPAKSFSPIETVENILGALENTVYNGFPVVNSKGRLIGLINRNTLITLVNKCCFYCQDDEQDNYHQESFFSPESNNLLPKMNRIT
jgi:predicted transcriptional regulator